MPGGHFVLWGWQQTKGAGPAPRSDLTRLQLWACPGMKKAFAAKSPAGGDPDVLPVSLSAIEAGVVASRGMHTIEQGFVA